MVPDFQSQVIEWSSPPVDHLNRYVPSKELLGMSDDELHEFIRLMEAERYQGWRNFNGLWRSALGLDTTYGKRVLDYGCGVGLEALQFAKRLNDVELADISFANLQFASRVLRTVRPQNIRLYVIKEQWPFIEPEEPYDIFYCAGVLHHIWYPQEVMKRAWEILVPGGEARLMLYTDHAWRNYVGSELPEDTANDPGFSYFVRAFDQVGNYADWYDADKVQRLFGEWFNLEQWTYLTPWKNYAAAILRRK
jgi:SAM-dependent methyltransferase